MPPNADYVRIATFDSLSEAAVVHALLEAHGIRVDPENVAPVGLLWPVSPLLGRVPLQVHAEDVEGALSIIEAYRSGALSVDEDPGDPEETATGFRA